MNKKKLATTEFSSMDQYSKLTPIQETAQVDIVEALTLDEERDRSRLELRVVQTFYQAGKALAELRNRRLYRSTHKTFEAYCQDTFEFTRRHSDYLIAGASVVENLQQMRTIHSQPEFGKTFSPTQAHILPTKLEQIKPLASLKPEEQQQAWNEAIAAANGKVPSGRIVRGIVQQLSPKSPVQAVFQSGDVFTLVRLVGKERKYNGCWAIMTEPGDSTMMVEVHDATLTVSPDNLAKIDSLEVKQQLPQILQRIRRLREVSLLDRGANTILKALGKHQVLTPVEEGLLSWLETYYRFNEPQSES